MTEAAKHAGGRPRTSTDGVARARDVRIPVSPEECETLTAWAKREGKPLATIAREHLLRTAKRAK